MANVLPTTPQPAVRRAWWLMTIFAVSVGLYALFQQDARPASGRFLGQQWIDHVHFTCGGLALLVGPFSFRRDLLACSRRTHRAIGIVYVTCVLLAGVSSLLMASVSMAGLVAHLGFAVLGCLWLATTAAGLLRIRRRDVVAHRRWMVRSYALCFGAATLRPQLPVLVATLGDFEAAFRVVSWSAWVPNLIFAEIWLRNTLPNGRWSPASSPRV